MSEYDIQNHQGDASSPTMSGVVLHILIQKQERCGETTTDAEVSEFKTFCMDAVRRHNGIVSNFSDNVVLGIFFDDCTGGKPELEAANCIHELRNKLYDFRKQGWQIILKAGINGGEITVGHATGDNEYEVMGSAVSASFQIVDTTHPMQISLTRKVMESLKGEYHFVPRRLVDIGTRPVSLMFLHTPATEPCAWSDDCY